MKEFDLIIPLKQLDSQILNTLIKYIKINIKPKNIIIITSTQMIQAFSHDKTLRFLDENSLYKGLSLDNIKGIFKLRKASWVDRAGWYFQQFLKMAYAKFCLNNGGGGDIT